MLRRKEEALRPQIPRHSHHLTASLWDTTSENTTRVLQTLSQSMES